MYERKIPVDLDCGVQVTQLVLGAKWNPYIINCITAGHHRPVDFQKQIKGSTKRVLNKHLCELEEFKIIYKVIHATVPMKVEYFLTELGESLVPIIRKMEEWGDKHRDLFNEQGKCIEENK